MLNSKLFLSTVLTLAAGTGGMYFYYKNKFLKKSTSNLFISNEKDAARNMHVNRDIKVRSYFSKLGPDLPEESGILV